MWRYTTVAGEVGVGVKRLGTALHGAAEWREFGGKGVAFPPWFVVLIVYYLF